MPESRWDQSRQTVKTNLILAHLSLVFSAVLYFASVFIWVCLGWLLYDREYASYVSRNRVIDSKLATVLALSIVIAYPIYFWYHLKTNVAKIYNSLKNGSDSYLSVRLGLGTNPAELVLKQTVELNATLTDNLIEEGRALRSDMRRCLDMVESTISKESDKKPPRCPICLTPYDNTTILHVFDCGHHVCQDDIPNCTRNSIITCPMCRSESFQPPIRLYI